ncbi:MAG: prolipoprotein diacylglyceryl transferase [Caldiserica bacterium]|nr:prolipoprotein diacylglyceryl transferase [Caldisericota bacterium]
MYQILFRIGHFTIYTYGIFVALGFFLSFLLAWKEKDNFQIEGEFLGNLWMILIIAGLAGGKLLFIILHLPDFLSNPTSAEFWRGGFAYLGGFFLALLFASLYIRKSGYSIRRVSYFLTPYIPLGQAIGRIGCFFNGCCYGKPTSMPWGMTFPLSSPAGYHYGLLPIHPTQLYASIFNFILFLFLWKLRNSGHQKFRLFPLYFLIYITFRALLDIVRGDTIILIGNLTLLQFLTPFLLTLGFLWWRKWKSVPT